ncbi:MAG: hypothetical protein ABI321_10985, partial [Polyangia bacterium]
FSFSVPAGGGAGSNMPGGVAGGAGTPTTGNAGQSAPVNSKDAGGGAGDPGGAEGVSGSGGSFGTLPTGISSATGSNFTPANATAADYALCGKGTTSQVGPGAGNMMSTQGGDGCVVVRCKGYP